MKTRKWQAIIFDFDGVVVESGDIKTQAFANLYQAHGEAVMAEVAHYHRLNGGMSRYQKFHYFQKHILMKPPLTQEEEQELDRRFSELVMEAVITSEAVPGAAELNTEGIFEDTPVCRVRHPGTGTEHHRGAAGIDTLFHRSTRVTNTQAYTDRRYPGCSWAAA